MVVTSVGIYADVFDYGDDVAPSLNGLRPMFKICEAFVEEYYILFDPDKSKEILMVPVCI